MVIWSYRRFLWRLEEVMDAITSGYEGLVVTLEVLQGNFHLQHALADSGILIVEGAGDMDEEGIVSGTEAIFYYATTMTQHKQNNS